MAPLVVICLKISFSLFIIITRNMCIAEAQGGGHKMSGMEGGENWSKLGSLGGRVSTLALILEGEM